MRVFAAIVFTYLFTALAVVAQQRDPHDTPMYDEAIYAAIADHLAAHVGPFESVWHELVSPDIHVDIIPIPPSEKRPYWVLSTAGMSYREMTLPEDLGEREFWLRAELMVALPPDWFGEGDMDDAIQDEAIYFPIRRLKELARYPHNAATSLIASHTFLYNEPLGPGTEMSAFVIWWPTYLAEGDNVIKLEGGGNINLYSLIPIYAEEREYAVQNGTGALLDLLADAGVTSLFDIKRPSVVPRQKAR